MAKTYLDIVKYLVEAKFSIDGIVDKPDIIGAVFGQTEGLLGDELDLRELQKSGKIGRIEIEVQQQNNKSHGKLYLPASLDRIETCILGAAVESVDRVGPYEAQFSVEKIEDTRSEKRRKILDRAKILVKQLLNTELPDSKELSELVQSDVRTSEITSYGPDKLPAGPDVAKNPELIIVEGRADVLNLLRNDMTNVVAIGGASVAPKSVISLCREKDVTVFLDGDRGGDLILRSLSNVADIDFVARAPDGKEVEDLTRKEIIKAIRTKVPLDQYMSNYRNRQHGGEYRPRYDQYRSSREEQHMPSGTTEQDARPQGVIQQPITEQKLGEAAVQIPYEGERSDSISRIEPERYDTKSPDAPPKPALESVVLAELGNGLNELSGTLRSRLYDQSGSVVKEMPIRELIVSVQNAGSNVYAIVLDGVITQRLVELALQKGIHAIYGLRANPMQRKHTDIILYTKEKGTLE